MLIKSISKISLAAQLPKEYFIEGAETEDIKRKTGYISVNELDEYLQRYMAENLPPFFDAYLAGNIEKSNCISGKKEDDKFIDETKDTEGESRSQEIYPQNIMRSDVQKGKNACVFGSNIRRKEVVAIRFSDKFPKSLSVVEKCWDVSEAGDESVMLYAEKRGEYYVINICGEGRVTVPINCRSIFENYNNLLSIHFNGIFDTSQVSNMMRMFRGCESLVKLEMEGFDTSRVMDMSGMFDGCKNLETLNVGGFDTSRVTDMSSMFSGCERLKSLDLRGFDTSRVTNMHSMFFWCKRLTCVDLGEFNTSRLEDMDTMFFYCENLETLDVSVFDMSKWRTHNMFFGCGKLRL